MVSLLRFIVLVQLAAGSRTFYVYGSVAIVTTIELCTAILTANMPSLLPVWRKHVTRTLTDESRNKYARYELGTVSQARGGARKLGKGSMKLRSQNVDVDELGNGSEEELFRNRAVDGIMVSTQVDVTRRAGQFGQ